jgi:hypothetical protein
VSADVQISADAQSHAQISAQINSQMFRSVQMLRSMCVGVSVCACVWVWVCVGVCCVWVCVCLCLCVRVCVGVFCVCLQMFRSVRPNPWSDQCSKQFTDVQISAQMIRSNITEQEFTKVINVIMFFFVIGVNLSDVHHENQHTEFTCSSNCLVHVLNAPPQFSFLRYKDRNKFLVVDRDSAKGFRSSLSLLENVQS